MKLSELTDKCVLSCRQSTKRGYQYKLNFVVRYLGDLDLQQVGPSEWNLLRRSALEDGKNAHTIEVSIRDVASLMRRCGKETEQGTPLKRPAPQPNPATLEQVNAACKHAPDWLKAFLALAYVTGLRRGDLMRLDLATIRDSLTVQASKTGKVQRFPIPGWCQRQISALFQRNFSDNSVKNQQATPDVASATPNVAFPSDPHTIYRNIRQSCKSAGVDYFTPQQVRILSARTWERLQPGLGPLILGHSLPGWSSATKYYLDPWEALFDRVHDFPPLDCLLTLEERCEQESARQRLHRLIERLDQRKRETLTAVAEGLAG